MFSPSEPLPGHLREFFDSDPKLIEQLRNASIVIVFGMLGGKIAVLFGEGAYRALGGRSSMKGVDRFDAGVSEVNDKFFPPGTFVIGCHADTDDEDVLIEAMRLAGKYAQREPGQIPKSSAN